MGGSFQALQRVFSLCDFQKRSLRTTETFRAGYLTKVLGEVVLPEKPEESMPPLPQMDDAAAPETCTFCCA